VRSRILLVDSRFYLFKQLTTGRLAELTLFSPALRHACASTSYEANFTIEELDAANFGFHHRSYHSKAVLWTGCFVSRIMVVG
jgi:hypothetical protein